jgi:alkylated DNA nucleotide flippase Atl1
MKRYRQVAKLMGNAKAWIDWHNSRWGNGKAFAECSLGYADIARVLGVSKSTARRVALAIEGMVDGTRIQWSRVTERKVLVMRLTKDVTPDPELADVYYEAYNAEFARLERLYPQGANDE